MGRGVAMIGGGIHKFGESLGRGIAKWGEA